MNGSHCFRLVWSIYSCIAWNLVAPGPSESAQKESHRRLPLTSALTRSPLRDNPGWCVSIHRHLCVILHPVSVRCICVWSSLVMGHLSLCKVKSVYHTRDKGTESPGFCLWHASIAVMRAIFTQSVLKPRLVIGSLEQSCGLRVLHIRL